MCSTTLESPPWLLARDSEYAARSVTAQAAMAPPFCWVHRPVTRRGRDFGFGSAGPRQLGNSARAMVVGTNERRRVSRAPSFVHGDVSEREVEIYFCRRRRRRCGCTRSSGRTSCACTSTRREKSASRNHVVFIQKKKPRGVLACASAKHVKRPRPLSPASRLSLRRPACFRK